MNKTISFIGTGKMATALISYVYKNNISKSIIASDRNDKNLANIKKQFKIKTLKNSRGIFGVPKMAKPFFRTTKDNKEAARNSDIVFICVKPQNVDNVLNEIKNVVKNQLIVSIAAGITLKHLESKLKHKRVIRVMPNINCLVGEMAAGFSAGRYATKKDIGNVSKILNSAGVAFFLKEDLLDVVTALSGSGPAFFAYFIEALAEAGIRHGLQKDVAFRLSSQTTLGTGKLLMEKNISPNELTSIVASKKGTTIAGLNVFKKYKIKNILIKTINAAVKRSKELGK